MAIWSDLWTLAFWLTQVGFSIGPTKSCSLFAEGSTATKIHLTLCRVPDPSSCCVAESSNSVACMLAGARSQVFATWRHDLTIKVT